VNGRAQAIATTWRQLPRNSAISVLLAVTTVAAAVGSAIGSHITVKASPKFVKVAFAFILWFFAGQIALNLLGLV